MKMLILVTVILLLIITLALTLYYLTNEFYADLQNAINSVGAAVEAENWELVDEELEELEQLWHKSERMWSPIMDHKEVNQVDESITRLTGYAVVENRDDMLVEIVTTRRALSRLKDNESPGISSIF